MPAVCEDPGIVIDASNIELGLIDVNESAVEELSATLVCRLNIVFDERPHEIVDASLANPLTGLLAEHLLDDPVGQAQHQALVDHPGLEPVAEQPLAESADLWGRIVLPAPSAVSLWTLILRDGFPAAIV